MALSLPARIDYLSGSFPVEFLEDVMSLLESTFGEPVPLGHGGRKYATMVGFGAFDAFVFFSKADSFMGVEGKPHAAFEIKGSALSSLDPDDGYDLVRGFLNIDDSNAPYGDVIKLTRIDCAVDDFDHRIEPDALWAAHCKSVPPTVSGPKPHYLADAVDGHGSAYFGRPGRSGGGCQLVVYDKCAQTQGVIDAVRWEARFFKARAEEAWKRFVSCYSPGDVAACVGSLVGGVCEFWRDVRSGHKVRRSRAPWWAALREELGADRVSVPSRREPETLAEIERWLVKVCGPRLALMHLHYSDQNRFDSFVRSMVSSGERRLRPGVRRLVSKPADVPPAFSESLPF